VTARVVRPTSRLLVLDEDDRLLLMRTKAPGTSGSPRWITPGGGVDPGEDHPQAAVRELLEETGQVVADVGPVVRVDDFEVPWDDADHTHGHAEFFGLDRRRARRHPRVALVDDRRARVDRRAGRADRPDVAAARRALARLRSTPLSPSDVR
jgi:8-oxo-dGTP pyrophosphatase MutT (NUDIX family)